MVGVITSLAGANWNRAWQKNKNWLLHPFFSNTLISKWEKSLLKDAQNQRHFFYVRCLLQPKKMIEQQKLLSRFIRNLDIIYWKRGFGKGQLIIIYPGSYQPNVPIFQHFWQFYESYTSWCTPYLITSNAASYWLEQKQTLSVKHNYAKKKQLWKVLS